MPMRKAMTSRHFWSLFSTIPSLVEEGLPIPRSSDPPPCHALCLLLLTEEAGFWKDLKKILHFYEFSHLIRFLSLCHWKLNVLFVQSNHLIHLLNKLVFCFQNCSVRILFVNSRPSVLNLKSLSRSPEKFIKRVKGKNNFWNRMFF